MAKFLSSSSRLRFGTFVSVDGVEFWDTLDLPEIPVQSDDVVHVVSEGERVDLIANRYYGDAALWWVVAVANDLELPPVGADPGVRLRIPSPAYVASTLFKSASR